jgi:hypothetical protein
VTADAAGHIYLTGGFAANDIVGEVCGLDSTSQATDAVFVAETDTSGVPLWCAGFGSSGVQIGTAIARDSEGNIVIIGALLGTADFGGGAIICGAKAMAMLAGPLPTPASRSTPRTTSSSPAASARAWTSAATR